MNVALPKHGQQAGMLVVRLAIGGLFLWFGIDKLLHPEHWFGWIPPWFAARLPVSVGLFLFANGIFEISIAIALLAGRFTRLAAAAAGVFMTGIVLTLGANEVTIRDVGLIGGALAVFLSTPAKTGASPLSGRTVAALCIAYAALTTGVGIFFLLAAG